MGEGGDDKSGTAGARDKETAELAIKYLQSQLDMATAAYDNLDRKAAFLPPFLAGAAGLLLPANLTPVLAALLVPAVITGAVAGWYAIEALRTRPLQSGPLPDDVAKKMEAPLRVFSQALGGVIAEAATARRNALGEKATAFNRAMRLAAVTLLLVAIARLIGGFLAVADSQDGQPTSAPSTTTSPASPGTPAPTATPSPASSNPAASDAGQPVAAEPMFAQGWEQKSFTEHPGDHTVIVEVAETREKTFGAVESAEKPEQGDKG